ncbi:unnamed protein product, partial [Prorocentrum cordatum]
LGARLWRCAGPAATRRLRACERCWGSRGRGDERRGAYEPPRAAAAAPAARARACGPLQAAAEERAIGVPGCLLRAVGFQRGSWTHGLGDLDGEGAAAPGGPAGSEAEAGAELEATPPWAFVGPGAHHGLHEEIYGHVSNAKWKVRYLKVGKLSSTRKASVPASIQKGRRTAQGGYLPGDPRGVRRWGRRGRAGPLRAHARRARAPDVTAPRRGAGPMLRGGGVCTSCPALFDSSSGCVCRTPLLVGLLLVRAAVLLPAQATPTQGHSCGQPSVCRCTRCPRDGPAACVAGRPPFGPAPRAAAGAPGHLCARSPGGEPRARAPSAAPLGLLKGGLSTAASCFSDTGPRC